MLALQIVLEMKTKQAKVAFLFTHIFSNNVHGLFSNSVLYFQFASFVWTKNAMPKLAHIRSHVIKKHSSGAGAGAISFLQELRSPSFTYANLRLNSKQFANVF